MTLRILLLLIALSQGVSAQQFQMIKNVPDHSQPPATTLPSTIDSNFCAPFAFLNIIDYWENIQFHPDAQGMMAGLPALQVSEYIGWFMDTNDRGSPARMNGAGFPSASGTYIIDQFQGIQDYVSFDQNNPLGFPFTIPALKVANSWDIQHFLGDIFPEYQREINDGFPVKLDFLYWHIIPTGDTLFDPGPPVDTILIHYWGPILPNSAFDPEAPWEEWNLETGDNGIGHAVTGVGYIVDTLEFAIVHDNWRSTPKNIAIQWINPNLPMQLVTSMIFIHLPAVGIESRLSLSGLSSPALHQNYPNPFNPVTTFEFYLPTASQVRLKIFNIAGEEVATLLSASLLSGNYEYEWDASGFASGVYFYCLSVGSLKGEAGELAMTKKLVLLR